jgi:lipid A 3-O-deacylase
MAEVPNHALCLEFVKTNHKAQAKAESLMKKFILLFGFILLSLQAQAQVVAFDLVKGEGDVLGLRLGYRPTEWHLAELPLLGDAQLYLEASANLWRYGDDPEYESNLALALSPVLTKQFTTLYQRALYWEFGIGVSLLNRQRFAGKDLGSHYQFEDRIGLIWQLHSQAQLALRYMHYSNAGLERPNPGLDFIALSYAYRF